MKAHSGKIRLLMGIPHPKARGGPPTHIPHLVDYFSGHPAYEIKTFYFGSQAFGTEKGLDESLLKKVLVTIGKLFEYLYYLATYRPHVVQLNTAAARLAIARDFPFAVISMILRTRLIFKFHGSHADVIFAKGRILRAMVHVIFRGATKVGVLSDSEREEYIHHFGYPEKLVITKNIVAAGEPLTKENPVRPEHDSVTGLFVSRIEEKKGLKDLLHAMPYIIEAIPTFNLVVAGDGPDTDNSVRVANELGVSDRIEWRGHVENSGVQQLYRQCAVFIFPTHYPEGMPMVLVEALRAGIPLITTKCWFARSYLEEPTNCFFVETENPKDLAEKIVRLMNNPQTRQTMRRSNPELVQRFSKANVGSEFEKIYQEMLSA